MKEMLQFLVFLQGKPSSRSIVYTPSDENKKLLEELGKYRMTKVCIYFKKLEDLNLDALEKICKSTIEYINENHECGACRD